MTAYLADGTRVTITRTGPNFPRTTFTGTIRNHGTHGFHLSGDDGSSSWFADSTTLLHCHDITQVITPT